MKKLNIAIIGLGNIGSYLYKYLNKNKRLLSKKNNCIPNILFVSAKNKFSKASDSLGTRSHKRMCGITRSNTNSNRRAQQSDF